MSYNVLFLCPHAAAKSVLAAAYFNQLAEQEGLAMQADAAGTEPDAQVSPAVVEALKTEGIDVSRHQPRRVTDIDLTDADYVISLGCDSSQLQPLSSPFEQWDDIPLISRDLPGAREAIRARVEHLFAELRDQGKEI